VKRLFAPLGVAAALLAASCSSDPVVADDRIDDALTKPHSEADPTPLEKELASGSVFDDSSAAALTACMVAAGFDGFVVVATGGSPAPSGDDLTVEEYAAAWGYGISTVLAEDGSRRADAPSFASSDGDAGWAEYRRSLSEERQAEFDIALYGDGTTSGCVAEALSSGGGSTDDQRELDSLLRELYSRIDADPGVAAALDRYAACMDDAGYGTIDTPADALSEVGRRTESVFGGGVDPALEVPAGSDGQAPVPGVDDAAGDGGIDTTPVTVGQLEPGALAAVQDYERTLAVAELPCRVRHELEVATITEGYEKEFVEANADLLDRVR
jgi:hypothetical protein